MATRVRVSFLLFAGCGLILVFLNNYLKGLQFCMSPNVDHTRSQMISKESRPLNKYSKPVDNYYQFPCVKELDSNIAEPCVRTLCTDDACGNGVNCTALPLKITKNSLICTYNPQVDYIAQVIKSSGGWEDHLIIRMMGVLRANPDMMLLDVGCNIGVYTMAAAWMARRVICVDANFQNIRMVHSSLAISNLTEHVTLIWNALSYEPGELKLKIVKTNVGGSRIGNLTAAVGQSSYDISVQAITLDKLQPLLSGKQVFMKMDIENFELNALNGGKEFLKNIDVRYIQMELYASELRLQISKFLRGHGFLLFHDIAGTSRVNIEAVPKLGLTEAYFIKTDHLNK